MDDGALLTSIVDGRIRVDRADSQIAISKDLLDELERATHPDVSLADDVLEIRATNGTFRYELDHWGWTPALHYPVRRAHRIERDLADD